MHRYSKWDRPCIDIAVCRIYCWPTTVLPDPRFILYKSLMMRKFLLDPPSNDKHPHKMVFTKCLCLTLTLLLFPNYAPDHIGNGGGMLVSNGFGRQGHGGRTAPAFSGVIHIWEQVPISIYPVIASSQPKIKPRPNMQHPCA
jgi:hypothetical protein